MTMSDAERSHVYQRAVQAYKKFCYRQDRDYQEPDQALSEIGKKFVLLRNSDGELAKYHIKKDRIVT